MKYARSMWLSAMLCVAFAANAQQGLSPDAGPLQKSYRALEPGAVPLYSVTEGGYVTSVIAPPGGMFEAGQGMKSNDAASTAASFLETYKGAFGAQSDRVQFVPESVGGNDTKPAVKFSQYYNGVPIYGAQVSVALTEDFDVQGLISDIMRNTTMLDSGSVATIPTIDSNAARAAARAAVQAEYAAAGLQSADAELFIYDPAVVGEPGVPHLAYRTVVHGGTGSPINEEVLVDAHTNQVLLKYSLICTAKSRLIYDYRTSPIGQYQVVRAEGDPAAPFADANKAYDFIGDTYDFYLSQHGRDSYDDMGSPLVALVRLPEANAFFTVDLNLGPFTAYGDGLAEDDVVAHEVTHAVTYKESGLIYLNESGAINESLSDIWGESVDQVNGTPEDTLNNKWLIGEGSALGVIRSMKNPPDFGHPDRYSTYQRLPEFIDAGGVHINSGIGNKLFYLLVQGDTFNGYQIFPMPMGDVLDVYYYAQTNLLGNASNYSDLIASLYLAAIELGWDDTDLSNLLFAGAAVEIVGVAPGLPLRDFRAQAKPNSNNVVVTWKNPTAAAFSRVYIVRNLARFPENDADGQRIELGTSTSYVDTALSAGQHAHYKIVALFENSDILYTPQQLYVHEESRAPADVDYLSEAFPVSTDLSFTQLNYAPVGDWTEILESNRPQDYANHRFYSLSVKNNVSSLPTPRGAAATTLTLMEDRPLLLGQTVLKSPIPFYGRMMETILVSPNGFIAPGETTVATKLARFFDFNLPSYESHWATPKISGVFADLSPSAGGEVWTRRFNDRFVITYEEVPQFNVFPPLLNTFQIELFYSGHIRVTYLDIAARGSVAGLSDGRGIPQDPAILPSTTAPILTTDLSNTSTTPAFNINPIPIQTVNEGETIAFTVGVSGAGNQSVIITPSGLPLGATYNSLTRTFMWTTVKGNRGARTVSFKATTGSSVAYQNVFIVVRSVGSEPAVSDITIVPQDPEVGGTLTLLYLFSDPEDFAEGDSDVYWYRNGAYVNALTNQLGVPAEALQEGDTWYAAVVPRNVIGVSGAPGWSEAVTISPASKADINEDGGIDAIDIQLVINAVLGKAVGALSADANLDGSLDATDIQVVVNKVLK